MKRRNLWAILVAVSLSLSPVALSGAETAKPAATTAIRTKATTAKPAATATAKPAVKKKRRKAAAKPVAASATRKSTKTAAAKATSAKKSKATAKPAAAKSSSAQASAASATASRKAIITASKVGLRPKPDKATKGLTLLTRYSPVEVIDDSQTWKKVKTPSGLTGYIDGAYLAKNNYVCTSSSGVKMRSGPGANDTALYALKERYPLRVIEKRGDRVRVVDCDGDGGWVHQESIAAKNIVIVKDKSANFREGPGVDFAKRFIAPKGCLLEVMEEKNGWLRVKCSDGDEGWCSAKTVWGWLPE